MPGAGNPGAGEPLKPDDHSEVVPLLPIPNRTVKRLCADDSADSRVKVGHCQANIPQKRPGFAWAFLFGERLLAIESGDKSIFPSLQGAQQIRIGRLRFSRGSRHGRPVQDGAGAAA